MPLPRFTPLSSSRSGRTYGWRVFWSYLPDWVLTIFLWGIFYLIDQIDGYRRVFSVTDTSLAHPYAVHERIPVWMLGVICGIVPAVTMICVAALHRSFWDAHSAILGLILGLGLTVTFTDIIKITAGRPRPDLFDRCQLPADLTDNPVHQLTSWRSCTRDDLLQEGFRSFPSGHSSFAWCGMWYLVLYLAAKMRTLNRRGYTIKSWLLLCPISCSALVSVSRTMDYRHHPTDVIAGAIIGVIAAWWAYRQYYPPVSEPKSWKPFPSRIAREQELPHHHRHDHSHNEASRPLAHGNNADSASYDRSTDNEAYAGQSPVGEQIPLDTASSTVHGTYAPERYEQPAYNAGGPK